MNFDVYFKEHDQGAWRLYRDATDIDTVESCREFIVSHGYAVSIVPEGQDPDQKLTVFFIWVRYSPEKSWIRMNNPFSFQDQKEAERAFETELKLAFLGSTPEEYGSQILEVGIRPDD